MGAAMGRETDALALFAALAEAPHRYDFYQTLRRLECLYDSKPRWGEALRPIDEPVRLGQDPD
jgi:type VI secretion system protein ImpH